MRGSVKTLAAPVEGVRPPRPADLTIVEAGQLWLRRGRREGLERTTLEAYEQHLRLHIAPRIGQHQLHEFRKFDLEQFRDDLLDGVSRPMAARVLRSLSAIFGEAVRRDFLPRNICSGVGVRRPSRERYRVEIPTKAELKAMITSAEISENAIDLPLILTAIFTGLRASELRGLPWRNVDLQRRILAVDQRADNRGIIGLPKSLAGFRTIPLAPAVVAALTRWRELCPETDLDLVFPSVRARVMSHTSLARLFFEPLQRRAGLFEGTISGRSHDESADENRRVRYSIHALRHAAASLWIEQGLSAKRVQTWIGHGSVQVTFDTYGHLFVQPEQDAAAAAAVELAVLGGGS